MNMLASLKTEETSKLADEKDSLGNSRKIFDSGAYPAVIGMAYTGKSDGGALGLFLTFLVGEEKEEYRGTLWMTSGDKKGNKPYYTKDGENFPLPGFSMAKSLALLTTGHDITDLEPEKKVIKLYSYEASAEIPTEVDAITDLIGKEVILGLVKQTVDVTKKGDDGEYHANGETREQNEIEKFFCAKEDHLYKTTTEIKAGQPANFYPEWVKKFNAGYVQNKAKGAAAAGTAGVPGKAGAAATGTPKPKSSLFGN